MKKSAIILILTYACFSASASEINNFVVPLNSTVADKPLAEYTNKWWQWAYSMNQTESPIRDVSGAKCHVNQQGDVWFLSGGIGTSKIKRNCTIPANKYVFFPVINMVYWPRSKDSFSCEQAKSNAALNNDRLLTINVELDGTVLSNPNTYRLKSPDCFNLLGMVPKEYNAPVVSPAATDGYWIMLKPLPKGQHTLKFNAQYAREGGAFGKMAQDIEYELEVK